MALGFAFSAKEKKTFSLILPKSGIPQFYSVQVNLGNADMVSNNIYIHYIIQGPRVTIQKLSLDKDYYMRGDNGKASLTLLVSAGSFARSKEKTSSMPNLSMKMNIKDGKGKDCTSEIAQPLIREPENPETVIPFKVKSKCLDPQATMAIYDNEGNLLDQKDFAFSSSTESKNMARTSTPLYAVFTVLVMRLPDTS